MVKKSLKLAIGPSVGIALGGVIFPRLISPHLYNATYPPIIVQAMFYLIIGYIVSFTVFLLIEWVKIRIKQ